MFSHDQKHHKQQKKIVITKHQRNKLLVTKLLPGHMAAWQTECCYCQTLWIIYMDGRYVKKWRMCFNAVVKSILIVREKTLHVIALHYQYTLWFRFSSFLPRNKNKTLIMRNRYVFCRPLMYAVPWNLWVRLSFKLSCNSCFVFVFPHIMVTSYCLNTFQVGRYVRVRIG